MKKSREFSDLVAAEYARGKSSKRIARELGVSSATVIRAIRRDHPEIEIRPVFGSSRHLERVVAEAIARQYREGMLVGDIARLHDIHPVTVQKVARRYGCPPRPPGRPTTTGEYRRRRRGKWAVVDTSSTSDAERTGSDRSGSVTQETTI